MNRLTENKSVLRTEPPVFIEAQASRRSSAICLARLKSTVVIDDYCSPSVRDTGGIVGDEYRGGDQGLSRASNIQVMGGSGMAHTAGLEKHGIFLGDCQGKQQEILVAPCRISVILTLVYLTISGLYIWQSSRFASMAAQSVEQLERIETIKGFVFIAVTGTLLFGFSYLLFYRIRCRENVLHAQTQLLLDSERRATAALFASAVAHDIRNILMSCEYHIREIGEKAADRPEIRKTVDEMLQSSSQLTALATRLMNIGRGATPGAFHAMDLAEVFRNSLEFSRRHPHMQGRTVEFQAPDSLPMYGNETLLDQMLINLALNAAEATKDHGRVRVELDIRGNQASIVVEDDGPGIPVDAVDRIFDPLYTTKEGGNGLGLLSVRSCVEAHKGRISITKSGLGGARFEVLLPLAAETEPSSV